MPRLPTLSITTLIVVTAAWLMIGYNFTFFRHLLDIYPATPANLPFLMALTVGFLGFIIVFFCLTCFRFSVKPVLIATVLIASVGAAFTDRFNVIIDADMLRNAAQTDWHEASDVLTPTILLYVIGLGLLPSILIARISIAHRPLRREIMERLALLVGTLVIMAGCALAFSDYTATFFREHKAVRYYFNPGNSLYGGYKLISQQFKSAGEPLAAIGTDARIPPTDIHRELVVFVVGETARADHFSLNGYHRDTNPLLEKERVINFSDVWSCGTATAISVPCMFSNSGREHFDSAASRTIENALDVLEHSGAHVLWRDNNSSSKGVADRVDYENYLGPDKNTVCDDECRDEGMLVGLQNYIDHQKEGDIAIILHQMGSHGPAYYRRYPKRFEIFTPTCRTNELKDCSSEQIVNAYDNTILYTDYFLSQVIALLKRNDDRFETVMLYVSDHGESLGENGLYLHGMPYMLAPDAQRHVPAMLWLGKNLRDIDTEKLLPKRGNHYTHDNIFHTLLGLMEIESSVYDPKKDITFDARIDEDEAQAR